jgi:hypothetical protein
MTCPAVEIFRFICEPDHRPRKTGLPFKHANQSPKPSMRRAVDCSLRFKAIAQAAVLKMIQRLISTCVCMGWVSAASLEPSPFELQIPNGDLPRISWFGQTSQYYDLHASEDLNQWIPVDGFPKRGVGDFMVELRQPLEREFYRMTRSTDPDAFVFPEVAAYKKPPFPRPPVRPNGCFRDLPPKANS